jgi:hypothetical protein
MDNFLIGVDYDLETATYKAMFADGGNVILASTSYEDAVLEADQLWATIYSPRPA